VDDPGTALKRLLDAGAKGKAKRAETLR
jgi:hypothetical protein